MSQGFTRPVPTTPVTVPNGGTGDTSLTAYAVLCGGTTSTGNVQSIAGLGSSGHVLTSNGAGALPTFQAVSGTGTVTNVATAGLATGGPITTTGTVTVTAAVKSDQTTATSTAVAVVPAIQQNHPSAGKVWGRCTVSGGTVTVQTSYNVSSVTRSGAGLYVVNLTTAFSSAQYSAVANSEFNGATNNQVQTVINSSSAFQVRIADSSVTTNNDTPGFSFIAFGTQ